MIARLYRMLPLIIVLALVAGIIYLVVAYRSSPNRAKEILIRYFSWLTGILSVFFVLATLYALLEKNMFAVDLMASFLGVALAALGVVLICRAVFLHNHPHYRRKASKAAVKKRRLR